MTKRRPAGASSPSQGRAAPQAAAAPASDKDPATPSRADTTPFYTISDLASEFAITPRTIRFYESRGLLAPERIGTQRRYTRRDRARLMLILRGRNLGFTVEDVGEYLALYDADPDQVAQTRLLLDKVSAAIASLQTKRADIDAALADLADIATRCERHLKAT